MNKIDPVSHSESDLRAMPHLAWQDCHERFLQYDLTALPAEDGDA